MFGWRRATERRISELESELRDLREEVLDLWGTVDVGEQGKWNRIARMVGAPSDKCARIAQASAEGRNPVEYAKIEGVLVPITQHKIVKD